MSNFDKVVKEAFENHDVNNPALESALIDIFKSYESRILSQDLVRKIIKEIDRKNDRDNAALGR